MDILSRVFHNYFNGTGSVYTLHPCRESTEQRRPGPTLQCEPALRYSVDSRIQTYTENSPQNIRGYTDIFTVYLLLLAGNEDPVPFRDGVRSRDMPRSVPDCAV